MNRIVINLEGFLDLELYRAIFYRIFNFSPVVKEKYDELVKRDNTFNLCGEAHSRKSIVLKKEENNLRLVLKSHNGADSMFINLKSLLTVIERDRKKLIEACSIEDNRNPEVIRTFIYVFDKDMEEKVMREGIKERCQSDSLCGIHFAPYPEEVIVQLFKRKFYRGKEFSLFERCREEFEQNFSTEERNKFNKRLSALVKSLVGPGCFREMLSSLVKEEDKDFILERIPWLNEFERTYLLS